MTSQPWFRDGLTSEESALVTVLPQLVYDRSDMYRRLLEARYTRSGVVSLPLAGNVNVWIVRNTPFEPELDTLARIAESASIIETFIGAPFPTSDVVLLVGDERTGDNQRVSPRSPPGLNYGSHITAPRHDHQTADEFIQLVTHELAHYYGYDTVWFNEAVAEFLEAYVSDATGLKPISETSAEVAERADSSCRVARGFVNIRHSLYADQTIFKSRIRECTYLLGQEFLLQTYEAIGADALSAAIRALQVRPGEETDGPEAELRIRDALAKHTPFDRSSEFTDLYRRLYGATPGSGRTDDHADVPEDATRIRIDREVEGSLDYDFDFDYFLFDAEKGQKYDIMVTHETLPASHINFLSVIDGHLAPWKSRIRSESGVDIQWVGPHDALYLLAVQNFGGHSGGYTISIERAPEHPPDDQADRHGRATAIELGERVEGEIHDEWDLDFFKFTTAEWSTYAAILVFDSILDACCTVVVFHPEGGSVAEGRGPDTVYFSFETSGWIWVVVHGGKERNTGSYVLEVTKEE